MTISLNPPVWKQLINECPCDNTNIFISNEDHYHLL